MDLFEKLREFEELKIKESKLEAQIRNFLYTEIIEKPYKIELLKAKNRKEGYLYIHFPVLEESEKFEKVKISVEENLSSISYNYLLKNSKGQTISVKALAFYEKKQHIGNVMTKFPMINGKINYCINAGSQNYKFEREFNIKELLEQILEDKMLKEYTYRTYSTAHNHYEAEKLFERFFDSLGKNEEIPTLKEIVTEEINQIKISECLFVNVEVKKQNITTRVELNNSQISVYLGKYPGYEITVRIALMHTGIKEPLKQEKFKFDIIQDEEKFSQPVNLEEVFVMK